MLIFNADGMLMFVIGFLAPILVSGLIDHISAKKIEKEFENEYGEFFKNEERA